MSEDAAASLHLAWVMVECMEWLAKTIPRKSHSGGAWMYHGPLANFDGLELEMVLLCVEFSRAVKEHSFRDSKAVAAALM